MNPATKLAAFGAGLVVAFGGAYGIAGAVVPDSTVAQWNAEADQGHGGHAAPAAPAAPGAVNGVSLSADGLTFAPVAAPRAVGEAGALSFRIEGAAGAPITAYTTTHEKDLHLIVVRTDGTRFRHVHPSLDRTTGTWSLPWSWAEAGTYRLYADFAPATGSPVTLSRTVEVAGGYAPVDPAPSRTAQVDGFTVTLGGDLTAGASSPLTLRVSRDGAPVTALQPYLGAFGHLVALRQGDLAFLHVHPEGAEPKPGDTGGPAVAFRAQAPTAGRYLLYLDFQVDGVVRTASFVLDAGASGAPQNSTTAPVPAPPADGHGGH
ncbi:MULTISPECIES: heavy-metal-associated domain-containing protein [Tsukamurella]|uniref:Heavy-metal-associated domain-containing protein n=2 Tax=Tsukamurella TaxID=2060 RepID=A0A5C5S7B5_9ACTN|nr:MULTISPECIES: heavy-metal-associated domain-containing protein [Tsukamurella]NMD55137.1 heavy-metal-associated domain-containing protein [Tsukamurella columbiensis]TWS30305.1 heavy-metal-associated domain-containing protein [Tsukamurella conjunctivitidis]